MEPVHDLLKTAYGVCQLDVAAFHSGELLGNVERLREESLELPRTGHDQLVLFGELLDTENGDDVLQFLVALQDALDRLGDLVVLLAHHVGVQDPRRRSQRVDGGIDAERGDLSRKVCGGVQMCERCGWRRIGVVVRRHVDCLDGRDRSCLRGGDALLQCAHFAG